VFPFGGTTAMLALVALAALPCLLVALLLRRRLGVVSAFAWGGLLWSVVVIAVVTLVPANGAPGVVFAEERLGYCSWDIGGPAPEGFWILGGTQRLLNTVAFVPSGALLVLALARWPRVAVLLVPLGLLGLVAYSVAIERTQLELARLDRACDVTDVLDNASGAALGVVLGVLLALVLRPWRARDRRS
jgi:hypothetical protein